MPHFLSFWFQAGVIALVLCIFQLGQMVSTSASQSSQCKFVWQVLFAIYTVTTVALVKKTWQC